MRKNKSRKNANLLSFHIIASATSGDVVAINKVLKYYEGYMIALSTRRLFDEQGRAFMVVDEEIRRTLETKELPDNNIFIWTQDFCRSARSENRRDLEGRKVFRDEAMRQKDKSKWKCYCRAVPKLITKILQFDLNRAA